MNILRNTFDWAAAFMLAALSILLPNISPEQEFSHYDLSRIYLLAGIASLNIIVQSRSMSHSQPLVTPFSRASLIICLLFATLSSCLSPTPFKALLEIGTICLLTTTCIQTSGTFFTKNTTLSLILLKALLISGSIYTAKFVASYMALVISQGEVIWPEPFPNFDNIRFFNQYQSWSQPLLIVAVAWIPERFLFLRALAWLITICWWMMVPASASRGIVLACAVATLTVLVAYRKAALPYLRQQGMVMVGGFLLYVLLFHTIAEQQQAYLGYRAQNFAEDPARLQLIRNALEMMAQHPWLGVGPMHYAYYSNGIAAHPHNSLLQIGAEYGIPVMLIVTGLGLWGLRCWLRQSRTVLRTLAPDSKEALLRVGLTAALISGITDSLISGSINMPVSQVLIVVIVGWALGVYRAHAGPLPPLKWPRLARIGQALLIVGSLAAVGYGCWPEITDLEAYQEAYLERHPGPLKPRFWLQGMINPD